MGSRLRPSAALRMQVRLLKCLVDNIVVDISFNQIGGLCTLAFLESMDRRVDREHLFKKSIILVRGQGTVMRHRRLTDRATQLLQLHQHRVSAKLMHREALAHHWVSGSAAVE